MKRLGDWSKRLSAFHKEHSLAILLGVYLTLGACATWSWQKSSERDLDCRFYKIEHSIAELEANLVSHNLNSEQTLLTILKSSPDFDPQYIEDIKKINRRLIDSSDAYLKGTGEAQKGIDQACDEMSEIGWSFLAIALFVGLAATILTTNPMPSSKSKIVKKRGDPSG